MVVNVTHVQFSKFDNVLIVKTREGGDPKTILKASLGPVLKLVGPSKTCVFSTFGLPNLPKRAFRAHSMLPNL